MVTDEFLMLFLLSFAIILICLVSLSLILRLQSLSNNQRPKLTSGCKTSVDPSCVYIDTQLGLNWALLNKQQRVEFALQS